MKEIKRVEIHGFQSHEDTDILLSPGVNVIIGPSDSGKSAIFRAIKWVLRNEPRGDAFINKGFKDAGKACIVMLHLADGISIARSKGPGGNQYYIYEPNKKDRVFSGFGNDIPEEVLAALGIQPIDFGENIRIDMNFGNQLDAPFLLSETPRTPAVVFGHLVGLDQVDAATRLTSKQKRKGLEQVKSSEFAFSDLNERLAELPDIRRAQELLPVMKLQIKQTENLEKETNVLQDIKDRLELSNRLIASIQKKLISKAMIETQENHIKMFDYNCGVYLQLAEHQKIIQEHDALITSIRKKHIPEGQIVALESYVECFNHEVKSRSGLAEFQKTIREHADKILTIVALRDAAKDVHLIPEEIEKFKQLAIGITSLELYRDNLDRIDKAIGNVKNGLVAYRGDLLVVQNELDVAVTSMEACPYSGGILYDECKKLLKKVM